MPEIGVAVAVPLLGVLLALDVALALVLVLDIHGFLSPGRHLEGLTEYPRSL